MRLPYRIRVLLIAVALLLMLALLTGCGSIGNLGNRQDRSRIPLEPCQLAAPVSPARLAAQCGKLTVYENRAAQSGRQIDLHIAVLPAISRTPAADPFVFITGGPGEAATQDFVLLARAFERMHEKRDIVLVDQRGTGQSHPLDCPSSETDSATDDADIEAEVYRCIQQLDADPRFYTTLDAVADLDQVRAALGYDRLNLYGVSYGTRVAQMYLAQYPDHVRTVILDGVVSPARPLGLTMASDAQRALDLIFARCAADPSCHGAFPDLAGDLAALIERVDKAPVSVTIPHPTSGEPTRVEVNRSTLATAIRLFSYSPETAALLPLLVHSARATGDFSHLAAQAQIVTRRVEGSLRIGLHNSVVCSEDVPFYSNAAGLAEGEKRTYMGERYKELERLCKYWPSRQVPTESLAPVRSSVPALLLSGEADPVTPPLNAEQVAATLPSSLLLVAPGQGHGIVTLGCTNRVAADFVEKGNLKDLDVACVQDIRPMPFFLTLTGTAP